MSWEGIRGTAQWVLFLLLAGVVGGAWFAQSTWSRIDEYIDTAVQNKLQEILPDWHVEYARITFDPAGLLALSDVRMTPHGATAEAIHVPRVQLELDSKVLAQRKVVVKNVTLDHPELRLVRFEDGHWNWESFKPPKPSNNGSPAWNIVDGRVIAELQSEGSQIPLQVVIERIDLKGVPEAARRHLILGECFARGIGRLALTGHFDPPRGDWELRGRVSDVQVSSDLMKLTRNVVPQAREKLSQVFPETPSASRSGPLRFASNEDPFASSTLVVGPVAAESEDPVSASVVASFRIGQHRPHLPLDYELNAEISNGRISQSIIPIPLFDLHARFQVTPQQFVVQNLSAANGSVKLLVDGGSLRSSGSWNHKYLVKATSLRLDERIRGYLPAALQKIYDSLRPSGTFDLDVDLEHSGGVFRQIVLRRFRAVDCRILPSVFAYPVSFIQGEIVQQAETFLVDMRGMAGERPVSLKGRIQPGGPESLVDLRIEAEEMPLDETFLNAFQLPSLRGARHALELLRASGVASGIVRLFKRPHEDTALKFAVHAHVRDASMNFKLFPYPLENITGEVVFDPLEANAWQFRNLRAERGTAKVSGNGRFDLEPAPGVLSIQMSAAGVPINHELHLATVTASPVFQQVWDDYGLSGTVDIDRVNVAWSAGLAPLISMDGIQWHNGTLEPKALPYRWENVVGAFDWYKNRLTIHSLQGWHGETYLNVDGSRSPGAAFIEFPEDEQVNWRLHVDDLKLVKLNPDQHFRRALPDSLAAVLDGLDFQGKVDLQSGLDLRGWNDLDQTMTAQWSMNLLLDKNRLTAGLELSEVTGKFEVLQGDWDGQRSEIDAAIELNSARVLGMPFTKVRAPLRVSGERVIVGTPTFSEMPRFPASWNTKKTNPYSGKQLTSTIYGGWFGVDAEVRLHPTDPEQIQYRAELKMADVEINEWARDQKINGQGRLRGKANGEVRLSGQGTAATNTRGTGWLDATPAELYELPVMAQMFSLLKFRPPEDTAFNYGYCDFTIHDGIFDFSRITLIGEVLKLAGRGFIGYAGTRQSAVNLDFYSQTENRFMVFQPVVDLLGNKWIRVQVLGTVDNPVPVILPQIGPLDTVLGGLLRAREAPQRRFPEIPPTAQVTSEPRN